MALTSRGKRKRTRSKPGIPVRQTGARKESDTSWSGVARRLEADVEAGTFQEGGRLPTEAALTERLGVNRHTLRRGIDELVRKGFVRRVPHVGIFVAPKRIPFKIGSARSIASALDEFGLERGHNLVSKRPCRPPATIARWLGVAQRTEVIEVVHVSMTNMAPFSQVTTWLPADRFRRVGDLMATSGNVREALLQLGIMDPRRKAVRITSRRASKAEATLLALPSSASVLVIDSLSVDQMGEPTHVSQCVVDAGRVELVVDL